MTTEEELQAAYKRIVDLEFEQALYRDEMGKRILTLEAKFNVVARYFAFHSRDDLDALRHVESLAKSGELFKDKQHG